jgi:hypothetical protein
MLTGGVPVHVVAARIGDKAGDSPQHVCAPPAAVRQQAATEMADAIAAAR